MKMRLMTTAAVGSLICAPAFAGDMGKLKIDFVDHIKAELIEQDVYVERTAGSGKVFRVTVDDNEMYLDKPVFATAAGVHHDPMNKDAVGPYDKGRDLGFTLGEWLGASGSASYSCAEGKGTIQASFKNLVPGGLYTMWQFYLPTPFTDPFGTYDLPVGSRDGSESAFTAGSDGSATYSASIEPCLQGTGPQLAAGLAIAYHSDGKTYGREPGSMGDRSHVHLFAMLPKSGEMPN